MADNEQDKTLEEQALMAPKEPKDFSYLNCPSRLHNAGESYSCLCSPVMEGEGYEVYDECNFSGKDYKTCPRMIAFSNAAAIKLELLTRRMLLS
jgi:hypothetical protein